MRLKFITRLFSGRACRLLLLLSLLIATAGCGADSAVYIVGADVIFRTPGPNETRVDVEQPIQVVFDRPLEDVEVEGASCTLNGEPVADVVHERGETSSRLTLVPAAALEHHRVYEVRVLPGPAGGLRTLSWRFATDPGPAGLLWERADAPLGIDLMDVAETYDGFLAVGEGGTVLSSPLLFGWRSSVGAVGESGTAQNEDLVWLWPGSHCAVLTRGGTVYVGSSVWTYMQRWDPPTNLWVRSMWGVTDILAGSLRDTPDTGFLSSSYPGVLTITGEGRGMRAAAQGLDDQAFFLGVGEEGSVFFSRDRSSWEDVNHRPEWGVFHDVIGGFPGTSWDSQTPPLSVAGGDILAWSEDGRAWQQGIAPSAGVVRDLSWDGYPTGEFLAVGEQATILHSLDGKSWTSVDTGIDLGGADLYAVSAGPSRWVVVGEAGVTLISPPNPLRF